MKNKLTIDLNKTEEGYNGITRQPYLWTIIDEGKEMYEVQIIKLNFPSTKKDIRSRTDSPRSVSFRTKSERILWQDQLTLTT
jgi:hypothetical protein